MTDLAPLRALLARLLARHGDEQAFTDTDSLAVSGRLDSVDLMDITFFLEEHYGADFSARDIVAEEFDSVQKIAAMLPA